MRSKDDLLVYADLQQLIGIEQKVLELQDVCLDSHRLAQVVNLLHSFEAIHSQRVRDYFTYRDKVTEAREAYSSLKAKYEGLRARNKELSDKLETKFEEM